MQVHYYRNECINRTGKNIPDNERTIYDEIVNGGEVKVNTDDELINFAKALMQAGLNDNYKIHNISITFSKENKCRKKLQLVNIYNWD